MKTIFWVLLIWSNGESPATVYGYTSKESCSNAGEVFIAYTKSRYKYPTFFVCLPNDGQSTHG